jgi:hypothetical protein
MDSAFLGISIGINAIGLLTNGWFLAKYCARFINNLRSGKKNRIAIHTQICVHLLTLILAIVNIVLSFFEDTNDMEQVSKAIQFLYFCASIGYYSIIMQSLAFINKVNPGIMVKKLRLGKVLSKVFWRNWGIIFLLLFFGCSVWMALYNNKMGRTGLIPTVC